MAKVGVIDSNICNLTSVLNALHLLGFEARSIADPDAVKEFSHLVLPGVGSFARGMATLSQNAMDKALADAVAVGTPLLGICLGMQLLADESSEFGPTRGLGFIPGSVTVLTPDHPSCRVPHIGWNATRPVRSSILFRDMPEPQPCFYFVHSYGFAEPGAPTTSAVTDHGGPVVAAVELDNVFGVQFHPERSQRCGLQLLKNFVTLC